MLIFVFSVQIVKELSSVLIHPLKGVAWNIVVIDETGLEIISLYNPLVAHVASITPLESSFKMDKYLENGICPVEPLPTGEHPPFGFDNSVPIIFK